jgi:membrane protein implicated in regulation of membrane protease activity
MWWAEWWVWGAFAVALVILEVLAPGYIFLGFGIAAGIVAGLLMIGGSATGFLGSSLPVLLVVFAVISLISWLGLRRFLGITKSQVKTFDEDING